VIASATSLAAESLLAQSGSISREAATATCPVCQKPCLDEPLYRYTGAQAAAHFCPPTRDADRYVRLLNCVRRLWNGDECVVLRCGKCGFGFGQPFVGGDEEFYDILLEQKDYPTWRWDYDVALLQAVSKFGGGRILDVGAGMGRFLQGLDASWQCFAVESCEATRNDLEAAGIEVFRDMPTAAQNHANTFQVITLFQVLEHVSAFASLLDQCYELLAPGGRIVVTVPDGDAMIRQERVTGCHDMPPNHIGKWTPVCLARALAHAGFTSDQPIFEPASWNNLKSNLHMRVSADASKPKSFAAQAYRFRNRPLRIAALSLLAGPALLRMLRYGRELRLGGAFAMIGQKPTQRIK
jgi:SAM-dependent methyltransferase